MGEDDNLSLMYIQGIREFYGPRLKSNNIKFYPLAKGEKETPLLNKPDAVSFVKCSTFAYTMLVHQPKSSTFAYTMFAPFKVNYI